MDQVKLTLEFEIDSCPIGVATFVLEYGNWHLSALDYSVDAAPFYRECRCLERINLNYRDQLETLLLEEFEFWKQRHTLNINTEALRAAKKAVAA